jgi:hypothetical protein
MKNTLYYWETENSHGQYRAKNDRKALAKIPKKSWVLYKESDTPTGLPFIILYDYKGEKLERYKN